MLAGGQLTGRFAWPAELIDAGRKYTREDSAENLGSLEEARRRAAREIVSLQASIGFGYLTDGGVGFLDAFTPYSADLKGVGSGGNIDKYPGTRNSYYHTPVVKGALKGGSLIGKHLYTDELVTGKKKAILPSPASLALASENSFYPNLEELMAAFAGVLREDVRRLEAAGYEMIQLNECFLTVERFSKKVGAGFIDSFVESIDRVFKGSEKRSCLYFHSGDASSFLPKLSDTSVTDLGFDFHTPPRAASRRGDNCLVRAQARPCWTPPCGARGGGI
jgi:methionine synthase II (cobalamin-independent)